MMLKVLAFAAILQTGLAQFSPSVTVSCAVGPEYTVTLTGGTTTGVIFIDGQCASQTTNTGTNTYVFDSTACTGGTVPALGTAFSLVVQEYGTINRETDLITSITCNLDTGTVTQSIAVTASPGIDPCLLTEEQREVLGLTCTASLLNGTISNWILILLTTVVNIRKGS